MDLGDLVAVAILAQADLRQGRRSSFSFPHHFPSPSSSFGGVSLNGGGNSAPEDATLGILLPLKRCR